MKQETLKKATELFNSMLKMAYESPESDPEMAALIKQTAESVAKHIGAKREDSVWAWYMEHFLEPTIRKDKIVFVSNGKKIERKYQ